MRKIPFKGLIWCSFYPLWGLIIAIAWRLEEPNEITTILVVWIIQIIALLIVKKAKRAKIIDSEIIWITAFSLKLLVTLVIVQYLWVPSYGTGGIHRQANAFDPAVYDYHGNIWAQSSDFTATVMYGGIIYYIGLIYKIFGVSTFYVGLFNSLLSLSAFLFLTGILYLGSRETKPWKFMALGMFLPEVAYFDAIPAKAALVNASLSMAILSLYAIIDRKKYLLSYCSLAFSLLILTMIRATTIIIFIAISFAFLLWDFRKNKKYLFSLTLMAVIFFVSSPTIISKTGGYASNISVEIFNISRKAEWGVQQVEKQPGGASNSLSLLFMPYNLKQAILFAPFRSVFFLVAPFPRLLWDPNISFNRNFTRLNVWCFIFLLPSIFAALFQKRCRKNRLYPYLVIPFILIIVLIANGTYIIHPRYRVMLDPILLATALFGYHCGSPKRFILPTLLVVGIGLFGYFFLKSIA